MIITNEELMGAPVSMTVMLTNTPPILYGLPDQVFDHSASPPETIDLWAHTSDDESFPDELTYTIEGTPPAGAGVTLDSNQYVTVRVTDPGGLWDEDTFRVAVSWSCPG